MTKILGDNYFHTHPQLEKQLGLDDQHVIVDKEDYYGIMEELSGGGGKRNKSNPDPTIFIKKTKTT